MKNLFVAVFSICTLAIFSQGSTINSAWSKKLYEKYTHTTFTEYKPFQETVNVKAIDYPLLHAAIFYLTNVERTKKRRKIVEWNLNLEIAAYHHSKAMVEANFFSHRSKLKKRTDTDDRAKLAGITNPFIAENIAKSFINENDTYLSLSKRVIQQWMNSSGHKANILNKEALQLGTGLYYKKIGQFDYVFATQNFQWYELVKSTTSKDPLPLGW